MWSNMQLSIWCVQATGTLLWICLKIHISPVEVSSEEVNQLMSNNEITESSSRNTVCCLIDFTWQFQPNKLVFQKCCSWTFFFIWAGEMKEYEDYFLLKSGCMKIHWLVGSHYLWAVLLSWTHEMLPYSPADYWMFYNCQEYLHSKLHSKCIISMTKGPGMAGKEHTKFKNTHPCIL